MLRRRSSRASRIFAAAAVLAAWAALVVPPAAAQAVVLARDPSGGALSREAVALCFRAAEASSESERKDLLERGLEVAERAVAVSDRDAKAHFALFCNLGRKLEAQGASLAGIASIQRLRAEIDRALALEPRFVDALAAKGALLGRLPAVFGGDADEGERLVRRAVELAPGYPPAHLELAKVRAAKGEDEAARAEAEAVLVHAGHEATSVAAEARELAYGRGS